MGQLLQLGADVGLKNNDGNTAFDLFRLKQELLKAKFETVEWYKEWVDIVSEFFKAAKLEINK